MSSSIPDHKLILALRVSLLDFEPKIWRRFVVPYDLTLSQFHRVIQAVMGWHDAHLYEFHTARGRGGYRSRGGRKDQGRTAKTLLLKDIISPDARRLVYVYDMGDYWEHELVLEEVLSNDTDEPVLLCVDGANQCPPEDIGGVGGYAEYLQALADPRHEDYGYFLDVYGDEFDPAWFDKDAVNQQLQKIKQKLVRGQKRAKRAAT